MSLILESQIVCAVRERVAKLDDCKILSLDVDKCGRTTCYDDMSGDALSPELVADNPTLEVEYLKNIKVYNIVSRMEFQR